MNARPTILCISSYEKGQRFLEEAATHAVDVMLLTNEGLRDAEWPREILADFFTMPDQISADEVMTRVYEISRHVKIDRVVALDEFDLEAAALVREEMRLPGMGQTTTRHFRDKLAMRTRAQQAGFVVPPFTGVFHHDSLRRWMDTVPGPWLLKPRTSAGAIGIRKIASPKELWRTLEELGVSQNAFLLEKFIPGDVFHVDSICWGRKVLSQEVHAYGVPPMELMYGGGVSSTRTLPRDGQLARDLRSVDQELVPALGMVSGVTHSEYIRDEAGELYFLESAARVGGAYIADVIEAATGINPWVEWARIEVAMLFGEGYGLPRTAKNYAGSVICLARQESPDLSGFAAPEIVLRLKKHHHAGLIVASESWKRVAELVTEYRDRFADEFVATAPVPDRPTS